MLTVGANLEAICNNLPARKIAEVQGIIVAQAQRCNTCRLTVWT